MKRRYPILLALLLALTLCTLLVACTDDDCDGGGVDDPFEDLLPDEPEKPVIYLYPEQPTEVTVTLDLDGVLTKFDKVIGLDRLKAIHVNDSLNDLGAKKDRHAVIGGGFIGLEAFARIVNHPALKGLPMVLETPNDLDGYAREIALLRQMEVE